MGDIVAESCAQFDVEFEGARIDGDIGMVTEIPERQEIVYQRSNSVFASRANHAALDWNALLAGEGSTALLHVTGITPLLGVHTRHMWDQAILEAKARHIPLSLELKHQKQLGALLELWAMVEAHCAHFHLIVLSMEELRGLAALAGAVMRGDDDEYVLETMTDLHQRWKCRIVVVHGKNNNAIGSHRQWSLCTEDVMWSDPWDRSQTRAPPKIQECEHLVKNWPEAGCGDENAWMARLLQCVFFHPVPNVRGTIRRMDASNIDALNGSGQETGIDSVIVVSGMQHTPDLDVHSALKSEAQDQEKLLINRTVAKLKDAKVIATLRSKGRPEVVVQRGVDLVDLGCCALEVAIDSTDWVLIVKQLRDRLPSNVALGIGNVMEIEKADLDHARSLGLLFFI
jgi:hypothetical protein